MRICKIDGKQVELRTSEWLSNGCPEVVGSTNLQTQEPFKLIDWSKGVQDARARLSKDINLISSLSDYIVPASKQVEHQFKNYAQHFKLIDYLLDWAFDCGWTGELEALKSEVDEVVPQDVEEELDATSEEDVDLNKLKFNTDGQTTIKTEDQGSENFGREESGVVQEIGHREEERSGGVLQPKAKASAKKKGRKRS